MGQSLSVTIQQNPNVADSDTPTHRYLMLRVWYNSTAGVDDSSNDFNTSGDFPGNVDGVDVDINIPFNGGSQKIYEKTLTVAKQYGASQSIYAAAWLSGINYWGSGNQVYDNATYVVPARPYSPPTAPDSVTATRNSDTSIGLSWDHNGSTAAPYASQTIQVSRDGGAFTNVANVSATASSYTYAAAKNHKYVFRVRASNSAGTSTSGSSNTILTTPNPLASLSAAVISSGTIRLTLAKRPTPYTEAQVVIEASTNGGSSWSAKVTLAMSSLSASSSTTWNDTSAPTGGNVQYRARVRTNGGTQGTLYSTYRTSNALVLNTPPGKPTNVTPSGPVDASKPIRLGWSHTPSSDGADQSSRKIEFSDDGGDTWTSIIAGNATAEFYDWEPDLEELTAGSTIVIRVATAGSQPGTYGAWSNVQTLTLYGSLVVTLDASNPPAEHGGGALLVQWTSSPTWGTASQARYQVTVTDEADGEVIFDTGLIASTAETVAVPATVQEDNHTYEIAVVLLDNHQLTSDPATRSVTTDYLSPGPVELEWSYDQENGTLVFYPTFSEETSSAFDDTVQWTLERSFDGDTWEQIGVAQGATAISDPLARLGAASRYRSFGYTELGVSGPAEIVELGAEDVPSRWGWINYGDGFYSHVRFGWSQSVDIGAGRASESYELEGADGDRYPAAVFGDARHQERNFTGKLLSGNGISAAMASSTADALLAMSQEAAVCVFRDAKGAWFHARVHSVRVSPARYQAGRAVEAGASFTVERITA